MWPHSSREPFLRMQEHSQPGLEIIGTLSEGRASEPSHYLSKVKGIVRRFRAFR